MEVGGSRKEGGRWVALEQDDGGDHRAADEMMQRQMEKTAQMFEEWGVVRDVRVLPNPNYMSKDESKPRFLQGTSVDEVTDRAVQRAILDMEEQRREEEEKWRHPDGDLLATIVPEAVEEGEDAGAQPVLPEDAEAQTRAANLKRIRWLGAARSAAGAVAVAETSHDRKQLQDWDSENPQTFPEEIVFPPSVV